MELEKAETEKKISKERFRQETPRIRTELVRLQNRLKTAGFQMVILISGNEGAGKSETIKLLVEWLDARGVEVQSFWRSTDEEVDRPRVWRYWRVFPANGRI